MKILQVNCVYGKGSTGKIMQDIHTALKEKGIDSVVCYGRGRRIDEPGVYKTCAELYSKINNAFSRFTGFMYGGCFFSTNRLIRIIEKERPDIVHLHCINGYFVNISRLITWLKEHRIKTVLTMHAEFLYTANCGLAFGCEKWKTGCGNCPRLRQETGSLFADRTHQAWERMKNAYSGSESFMFITSVSEWLDKRAKQSPFLRNHRHEVIRNGVDTAIFRPCGTPDLEAQYHTAGEKLVLHVTPRFSDPNKGGSFILKMAKNLGDGYRLLLVGRDIPNQCQVPHNVVCIGEINDQAQLAALYSISDVTVLASKAETFSLVCAESLCCGTPVVGFCAGGPERISLPEYSEFVEYGDLPGLETLVRKWGGTAKEAACWRLAHDRYSRQRMIAQYIDLYEKIMTPLGGKH